MNKEEIKDIKKLLKRGHYTVYSIIRHVSASGMSRVIDFFIIINNQPRNITYYMENILGYKYDRNYSGINVGGCGMDMAFHCVYSLSRKLYKKSNRYENKDGGYQLKSEIL